MIILVSVESGTDFCFNQVPPKLFLENIHNIFVEGVPYVL